MKKFLFLSFVAFMLASCSGNKYRVTVDFADSSCDGTMGYLLDYDTGDKIDSVKVGGKSLVFEGTVAQPIVARISVEGAGKISFVLEKGETTIDFTERRVEGGEYNRLRNEYNEDAMRIDTEYEEEKSASGLSRQEIDAISEMQESALREFYENTYNENKDNVIGYLAFLDYTYGFDKARLDSVLQDAPKSLKEKVRVKRWVDAAEKTAQTAVGARFKDFKVVAEDGVEVKLSDFVGNGMVTLVDFWASWCGPCIRETQVIREIYDKYSGKGLQVLGVAVWDDPKDTSDAILRYSLPWPQIINSKQMATDLYGIVGIPHIIVFDADGTILCRGLLDEQLKNKVDEIMARNVAEMPQ